MNLYLVVLGGKIPGGHVEIHDVRWVAGETIESTIPNLKLQWVGNSAGLHIDSFKLIRFVDGYEIKLVPKSEFDSNEKNNLWFINLGGYKEGEMFEQHHLTLVVAPSIQSAKQKARKKWSEPMKQIHKDNHYKIINLQGYSILLKPDLHQRDDGITPDWSGYWVIN